LFYYGILIQDLNSLVLLFIVPISFILDFVCLHYYGKYYMSKLILYQENARRALERGMDILAEAVLPFMKEEKFGRIINIISTSVKQPLKGLGVSNTIRAAVANWAKTLSMEVAADGVTVNNVLPGATSTARLQGIISNKAVKNNEPIDKISQEMMNEIPAGRFAEAEEIAAAVAFLASPAAAYINGINVPVDGGRTSCL
jgi:3-oxoacyl-[acyl-carrier protein] reductase